MSIVGIDTLEADERDRKIEAREPKAGTRKRERRRRASENIYLLVDIKANIIPSSLLLALYPSPSHSPIPILPVLVTSRQAVSPLSSSSLRRSILLVPPRIVSCKLNTSKRRMLCPDTQLQSQILHVSSSALVRSNPT